MARTGKCVPSATWVIPYSGQGMDKQRANSAWRMMTFPTEVKMNDVDNVYFRGHAFDERYFDSKDDHHSVSSSLHVAEGALHDTITAPISPQPVSPELNAVTIADKLAENKQNDSAALDI